MKYSELIKKCQDLISTYNQNIMTADSHADEYLSTTKCQDTQKVFMKQVFYGYQRYKGFLKASNQVILQTFSTSTNRKTDYMTFAIFTYLICFRMDELPFNEFKKIIMSQDMVKMNVLLGCIFDVDWLRKKVVEKWRDYLEQSYLEQKILSVLLERKNKCIQLISRVADLATGKKDTVALESEHNIPQSTRDKRKCTKFQQFNLTKPKPKQIISVEKLQVLFKAHPAPNLNKDLKKIEQQKAKRREDIMKSRKQYYQENKQKVFELQTSKRPSNFNKVKEEVQMKQTQQMEKKVIPKSIPKFHQVDIKLNVAAILRQEKKLKEKIELEQQKMKNLQINMRDQSEFQNWQKQMKQKDKYDKMEHQQRKKIQMELARQAAIQAFQQKVLEKKNLVQDMRQIANQLRQQREKLETDLLINKKKVIQQVQQIQQNINLQKEKLLQKNKKIHDSQIQERKRIQQKKKQEEKVEMIKKKQLIQQIRQLEKRIRARPKQQIQYISIGLLEQMTLDQLKKKLEDVKIQRKEEQEKKRQENIARKQQFKDSINQKKNTILQHRQQLGKKKQEERKRKKQQLQKQKERMQQVKLKSMNQYKKKQQQKLNQKKIQKQKLAKEIKQTDQRRMFLMQGRSAQQANAFMNLQKGQQRQIKDRQNQKLMQQYNKQSVKEGQIKIIAENGKRVIQSKIDFKNLYNQQQKFNNQMAQTLQQQDQATKAMQYHNIRTYQQKHIENLTKLNPFKSKIAQMSLNKSKKN